MYPCSLICRICPSDQPGGCGPQQDNQRNQHGEDATFTRTYSESNFEQNHEQ